MSTPRDRAFALTEALLDIVAARGLDQVSVREVAAAAGVSIGTVQHYFPTKDDMLAAAFREVVRRVRARLAAVPLGDDVRDNLAAVLGELLPLDERRCTEARIQVAFAARAMHAPALAEIQQTVLTELQEALATAFARAWGAGGSPAAAGVAAHLAVAAVDGLALHAVSTPGWLPVGRLSAALDLLLDTLVREPPA